MYCMFIVSFRCVDAEAYEVKRDNVSNGIFISFLKRRVCEDEKVTVMLDRVAEGVYANRDASWKWIFFFVLYMNFPVLCYCAFRLNETC